jgi:hypothetical protein
MGLWPTRSHVQNGWGPFNLTFGMAVGPIQSHALNGSSFHSVSRSEWFWDTFSLTSRMALGFAHSRVQNGSGIHKIWRPEIVLRPTLSHVQNGSGIRPVSRPEWFWCPQNLTSRNCSETPSVSWPEWLWDLLTLRMVNFLRADRPNFGSDNLHPVSRAGSCFIPAWFLAYIVHIFEAVNRN